MRLAVQVADALGEAGEQQAVLKVFRRQRYDLDSLAGSDPPF
jgi:hypothetical protein